MSSSGQPKAQDSGRSASLADAAGLVLSLLLGISSLPLPFGRDQGLYFYVAREWARHGSVPYRDVFDHKPPGLYVLYRVAIHLFGEVQWGIRVLDHVAVLACGMVVARLATPAGSAAPRGWRGPSCLLVAVLYHGCLNYWDTGQSELYYALLGAGAIACAMHAKPARAALGAGALSGVAFLMKPPVVWFALAALVLVWRRQRRGELGTLVRELAAFVLGGAAPVCVALAYFGAHHALADLVDVVVGANGYYVSHEHSRHPLFDAIDSTQGYVAYFAPFSTMLLGGGALATWHARRASAASQRSEYTIAWVLVGCAYAAVAMQLKFYMLHWTPMIPGLALIGTLLLRHASNWMREVGVSAGVRAALPIVLILGPYFGSLRGREFVELQMASVRYANGTDSRERFLSRFAYPGMNFSYPDAEWVGLWLRDHTKPSDYVTVRGFEPEVYAVAGRRHSGRFFWTTFLTGVSRAYRREAYLAEDLRAFEGPNRPKFVVARREPGAETGPNTTSFFEPLGYQTEVIRGQFVIMRNTAMASPPIRALE